MIGETTYRLDKVYSNITDFEAVGNTVKPEGTITLLGCFCAAPQSDMQGDSYIKGLAAVTGRTVIANQGESFFGAGTNFNWEPIGRAPIPPREGQLAPHYYNMGLINQKKWSKAEPNGKYIFNIGNLRLDGLGQPQTGLPGPSPTKLPNEKLPEYPIIPFKI